MRKDNLIFIILILFLVICGALIISKDKKVDINDISSKNNKPLEERIKKSYEESFLTITNISNTNDWKTYNTTFDGLNFYFKYPGDLSFSDGDFSSPILFYRETSENPYFEISRYYADPKPSYDINLMNWLKLNANTMFSSYHLGNLVEIKLPKNTVYKLDVYLVDKLALTYYVLRNNDNLISVSKAKNNNISDEDFYAVIESLSTSNCTFDCY